MAFSLFLCSSSHPRGHRCRGRVGEERDPTDAGENGPEDQTGIRNHPVGKGLWHSRELKAHLRQDQQGRVDHLLRCDYECQPESLHELLSGAQRIVRLSVAARWPGEGGSRTRTEDKVQTRTRSDRNSSGDESLPFLRGRQ